MTTHPNTAPSRMRLYGPHHNRLYINDSERNAFRAVMDRQPPLARSFCQMLLYTGCRISEACHLQKHDLQLSEGLVSIRSLKKRGVHHIREIPIPPDYVGQLKITHFGERAPKSTYLWGQSIWPAQRSRAYRWVKAAMCDAGIVGPQASPKGLRHGFGVHATRRGVQLHMLQRWLGHASMETTAIYATALGPEEREVAARMWA